MNKSSARNYCLLLFLFLLLVGTGFNARALDTSVSSSKTYQPSPQQEVFLSFNYRNLFDKVIIAYYEDGTYYLPVSEIFTTLKITNNVNFDELTLGGFYLNPENQYEFDFRNYVVTLDSKGSFQFDASKMLVKELDYYVDLEVFSQVFDLNFTVDLNNLILQLQSPNVLPIVEEQQRAERRKQQELYSVERNYHPLEYDRDRDLLGGGFLDYSLSANIDETDNSYNYNFNLGSEVLGGDLQGSVFGTYSNNFSNVTTNNLRWRYVFRNNKHLTQIYAGQTNSDGLISRNFTGVRLTNEPIEPRFLYDSYEIEGRAPIGSEVELYYNNALYDYKRVTDTRQYRFLAPLTYGTSRLRLRIYGPDGRVTERQEYIQIPFSFLPQGEFSYNLNAGRLDNPIFGSNQNSNIFQGDVAYGLSNWLTQKAGVEYYNTYTDQSPIFYSTTSARVLGDYLFNLDVAPGALYRFSGNVVYPSSASWELNYTYFDENRIYNPLGNEQEFSANVFVPFFVSQTPFNVRFIGSYGIRTPLNNYGYSVDLNSRINRFNFRLSYRDRKFGHFNLQPGNSSNLSASATYLISRRAEVPWYLQNTFISGRIDYNPGITSFEQAEIQASRSIFDSGRIQLSFSRNFIGGFNYMNLGLTLDLDTFRSITTARNSRKQLSFTQNIRGSIGFDDYNKDMIFSNRQQVGRSATSLRLYVDTNDSGSYDEQDEVINDKAVRIDRAGVASTQKNGILRFSQLQAYHRVNMEINESAIKNPLLIPKLDKFSIVTDPNQYKPINIPFYVSGVIEGKIERYSTEGQQDAAGIRLFLKGRENDYELQLQTFSDGSFYAYEIPPGHYTLEVDANQLEFLNARTEPKVLKFEVESLAQGDFVEGLDLTIFPVDQTAAAQTPEQDRPLKNRVDSLQTDRFYQIQLASYAGINWAKISNQKAEKLLGDTFFIRYNPAADLFALRTPALVSREEAFQKISIYQNSPFREPALVIARDSSSTSADLYPYFVIDIGPFPSEENARKFVKQLDVSTQVKLSSSDNIHGIAVGAFPSREKALKALEKLLPLGSDQLSASVTEINNDTITPLSFRFGIIIRGLDTDSAEAYLLKLNENGILPPRVDATIEEGAIVLRDIPSWNATVQLKQQIEQQLEQGQPILLLWQETE